MKNNRQPQSSKPNAKQQNAARNSNQFADVDAPEKLANAEDETGLEESASNRRGESFDSSKIEDTFKEFESSVENFAGGIARNAIIQAKETVVQAKDTIAQVKGTVVQAKETILQAKATVEAIKETARQVLVHMRNNPEPFIAAAVPGLIGVYLLIQRMRKPALT